MKPAAYLKMTLGVLCALIAILFMPTHAYAHGRIEVGDYLIIVGWRDEPPLVNQPNAISLEISNMTDGAPVTDAADTLSVEILYGGQSYLGDIEATNTPGLYYVRLIPTVRGLYTVRLSGTLGDTDIEETTEPEEIVPSSLMTFPEDFPDTRQMQQTTADLEAKVNTLTLVAWGSAGAAILAAALAVFALVRKPSR